jgi:hypothetical protein
LDPEVDRFIDVQRDSGKKAPEIYRELQAYLARLDNLAALPTLRTVQYRLKAPHDPSGDWRWEQDALDPAPVLAVLARVIQETEGRRRSVTTAEATWIRRIRRAAPSLDGWCVYRLARLCKDVGGELPPFVEQALAFAPWRDPKPYEEALVKGWIPRPPPAWRAILCGNADMDS